MRLKFIEVSLIAAVAIHCSVGLGNGAPLRVAYSAISGAMSSLWVAQEGAYFKREGLDVECFTSAAGRC